jgi:hypothetical protein
MQRGIAKWMTQMPYNHLFRTSWELEERGSASIRRIESWIYANVLTLQLVSLLLLFIGSITAIAAAFFGSGADLSNSNWVSGFITAGVSLDLLGLIILFYAFFVSFTTRTGFNTIPRPIIGYFLLRKGNYQPFLVHSNCVYGKLARRWLNKQDLTKDELSTFKDLAIEWQCKSRDLVTFIVSLRK